MLADNFYFIRSFEPIDFSLTATIEFEASHDIFKGHFPAVPVVPGVCMMQIVKELFEKLSNVQLSSEKLSGKDVRLTKVALMKFLTVINPLETPTVQVDLAYTIIDDNNFQVTASLFNENVIYFKFKGVATVNSTNQ